MIYSRTYLAVMLALACGAARAASLGEVTEQALARSPEVQARLHEFLASGHEQDAAKGARYPRVDLESHIGRERLDTGGNASTFTNPGTSLQLRQLLFDGFGTRNEIRRLGHTKAARYYELLATTDDVALETSRAFLDVQRYRQLTQLAQDNWAVHKETYDQIEQRVKAGVGRRVDLEQAAGRLALAQANWLTETSNLHDVGARFERVVGEPPPALGEAPVVTARIPAQRDYMPLAVQSNPGFWAAVSNVRAARSQIAVRKSAYYPTVEARAAHDIERNRAGVPGRYSDSVAQLVLNYNLYRGGSDKARIAQSEEQYDTSIALREKACRDLRQTAAIAWNDLRRLREQIQYLEQHALATEKARDAYRQQFDIGQRSLLDVLDTENELFEARRALVRAQYDLKLAEMRVLAAAHRILPTLGLAPDEDAPVDIQGDESANDSVVSCSTDLPRYEALDTAAAMAARTPRTPPPVPVPPPMLPPVPPPSNAPVPVQCEFAANDWASAWSSKNLDKYLSYYSLKFQPLTRSDQSAWKQLRAARLNKPSINVRLDGVQVKQISPERCEVSFNQQYRSTDYSDNVKKTLILQKEDKDWKIIQEIAPKKGSSN